MKNKISAILLSSILFLLFSTSVSAHLPGQEPFFKINNKYTLLYPVLAIPSAAKFTLPQDIAPELYKVNSEISLEIDTDKLPYSKESLTKAEYYWDFGDTEKSTGIKNTHSYEKIGSYVLKISIDLDSTDNIIQKDLLAQSTMINIVKNPTKPFPKIRLSLNNKEISKKDGTIKVNLNDQNTFEATLLNTDIKNTKIIWDFGDGKVKEGKKVNYTHSQNFLMLNPLVRIITADGYILDDEIVLENTSNSKKVSNLFFPLILINTTGLLVLGVVILLSKRRKKPKA